MALILPPKNPVSYDLCNQTITVYHYNKKDETYNTAVYNRAFFEFKKNQSIDKTGSKETNSFLAVIPCDHQTVYPGDKIILGVGPNISTREQWEAATPPKVPNLVVVRYVDLKFWNGKIVHIEVGG